MHVVIAIRKLYLGHPSLVPSSWIPCCSPEVFVLSQIYQTGLRCIHPYIYIYIFTPSGNLIPSGSQSWSKFKFCRFGVEVSRVVGNIDKFKGLSWVSSICEFLLLVALISE